MRYFVKSLFYGWREVSKKNFDAFVETIRKGSTAIPLDKKDEYIASRTAIINTKQIGG